MSTSYPLLLAAVLTAGCNPESAPGESAGTAETATAGAEAARTRSASPEGAAVRFITPQDGATVSSPVRVEFEVTGMELVPAGNNQANSGHHHILIDTGLPDLNLPVPADAQHVHFGDGSSSTELVLPRGKHTLQLLFADYLHVPHETPVYSEQIEITVE
jgi:hypothetical protein